MPVTDLTGTKWVFNDEINAGSDWPEWNINFVSNNSNYTDINFEEDSDGGESDFRMSYYATRVYKSSIGGWLDEAYRTIEITGGTDTNNSELITWLQNNATQVVPPTIVNGIAYMKKAVSANSYELVPVQLVRKMNATLVSEDSSDTLQPLGIAYTTLLIVPQNKLLLNGGGSLKDSTGGYITTTEA